MSVVSMTRLAEADARLAREFEPWRRRLISRARYRYRLAVEDCEELAADTLWTWYEHLETEDGVRADAAYLFTVLHHRALSHIKAEGRLKRAAETLPLDAADWVGADPQLDVMVSEREELADLAELARDILTDRELEVVLLRRQGVARAQIAERCGLSTRCVQRYLECAQLKLNEAAAVMRSRGRCAMLALTISDIKAGRIGPGHPRYHRGIVHLKRCPRCRTAPPIHTRQAA